MLKAKSVDSSPVGLVCLEGSIAIWKLLKEALEGMEGPSRFIFARSPETSADVLALCRRLVPALVAIEDSRLHLLPFKQLQPLIRQRDVQILVISDTEEESVYEAFFRMGCTGVVPNGVSAVNLRRAVLSICDGELWLPAKVLSRLAHEAFLKDSIKKITQRESEIFKLVCLGFTNQQIAEHLFISRETVRWHLRSLYSKIGVKSRSEAVKYSKHGNDEVESPPEPPTIDPSFE